MNIAERAFEELFPEKKNMRAMGIKYSRAFRPYNSNVRYTASSMTFRLSREWKSVSDEIKIGLLQSLLVKVFKEKKKTINMDLYENFLRNIGDFAVSQESDPVLEESFNRVNDKYFSAMIDKPSLRWGSQSFSKLGTYEYGANAITISRVLEEDQELLDYVMYHEMLHKKHKFSTKDGRSYHHTRKFRNDERAFENPDVEDKLKGFLTRKRWSMRGISRRATPSSKPRKKRSLMDWFFR
ncbi:MAG: SprT-like domain-containing protein [archaeon]